MFFDTTFLTTAGNKSEASFPFATIYKQFLQNNLIPSKSFTRLNILVTAYTDAKKSKILINV